MIDQKEPLFFTMMESLSLARKQSIWDQLSLPTILCLYRRTMTNPPPSHRTTPTQSEAVSFLCSFKCDRSKITHLHYDPSVSPSEHL